MMFLFKTLFGDEPAPAPRPMPLGLLNAAIGTFTFTAAGVAVRFKRLPYALMSKGVDRPYPWEIFPVALTLLRGFVGNDPATTEMVHKFAVAAGLSLDEQDLVEARELVKASKWVCSLCPDAGVLAEASRVRKLGKNDLHARVSKMIEAFSA